MGFTGTGTVADPIVFDGMSLVVGAGAATGDHFLIHPTRDAIRGFGVAITDPAQVAAAAPIRASAASSNAGTGTITAGEVLDVGNAQLLTTTNTCSPRRPLLGQRRRGRDLHARWQHRCQRLAGRHRWRSGHG